jgi:hypothetical protein
MSSRYPPPPKSRPCVKPGSGPPLRQWASASYSPDSGFAASGLDGSSIHGKPSAQPVREDSGFQARDRRATQNPTPVRLRKIG